MEERKVPGKPETSIVYTYSDVGTEQLAPMLHQGDKDVLWNAVVVCAAAGLNRPIPDWADHVYFIIIPEQWWNNNALREIFAEAFEQAVICVVAEDGTVTRLQSTPEGSDRFPECINCGTKMLPAGSCYVCKLCGNTQGLVAE